MPRENHDVIRETELQVARRLVHNGELLLARQERIMGSMEKVSSPEARRLGHELLRLMQQSLDNAKRYLAELEGRH